MIASGHERAYTTQAPSFRFGEGFSDACRDGMAPTVLAAGVLGEGFSSVKGSRRCCQSNANQSPKCQATSLSGRQLTPLGQCSRAVLLEDVAAVEVTVVVEDPTG